ncbi:RNA polymerase sigma factor [Paenibacillus aurantiacus]|uniref:RNA polymerase sigma factor n=1 Tax=Paenibacillus aurantiacus TaxID=1936118 RepID=A0ABV5KHR0_9BACL
MRKGRETICTAKFDWPQLWEQHSGELLAYILRLSGNRCDAEDILQETFLKGFVFLELQENTLQHNWIIPLFKRIARNVYVDCRRKARRDRGWDAFDNRTADFVDHCMDKLEVSRLMDDLKCNEKKVILYRFKYDFSIKDTAALLNRSEGSVKMLHFRALRKLRSLIS